MDIEGLRQINSTKDTWRRKKREKARIVASESNNTDFVGVLEKAKEQNINASSGINLPELLGTESLEDLLDTVNQAGEQLKRDPLPGKLDRYKTAVRKFLRYILEKGLEVDETTGIRNPKTMQQKKYVVIRVVDEKLERLAAYILKSQTDQFEILRRVDEIHGLLIDLSG